MPDTATPTNACNVRPEEIQIEPAAAVDGALQVLGGLILVEHFQARHPESFNACAEPLCVARKLILEVAALGLKKLCEGARHAAPSVKQEPPGEGGQHA